MNVRVEPCLRKSRRDLKLNRRLEYTIRARAASYHTAHGSVPTDENGNPGASRGGGLSTIHVVIWMLPGTTALGGLNSVAPAGCGEGIFLRRQGNLIIRCLQMFILRCLRCLRWRIRPSNGIRSGSTHET